MKLFSKLKFLFSHGDAIESMLKKEKEVLREQQWQANKRRLKLCLDHKQEDNQSHYSSHNCDHCKLLAKLEGTKTKTKTKTMEVWINIYPTCIGTAYPTKEQADSMASDGRLECRKITWEVEV